MKQISDIISGEITWVQPNWRKHEFEIRAGEDVIGTLSWDKEFGSLAIARSADGVWAFKRGGFIHPYISIRAEGHAWDFATFKANWNGSGSLTLHDGRSFHWGMTDMAWRWDWDDGAPLISIKAETREEKLGGEIGISPEAEFVISPSLLALLGCYIIILRWDEMAAEALAS